MTEAIPTAQVSETAPTKGVGRWHYVLLGLIILLGAGLRFAWLDRPALWGDEAATWARTCGTFEQMLEGNREDGFVPLHYELYWWMGQHWKLTPFLMRLVPAIAGVLMIPAMYFMARQMVRPGTALVVALMTATSAYYLNYSRDSKMYLQMLLALTLHMGFLLWWLRGGGGVAWWAWVAAGVAAVGLHASTWLVIPLGAVLLLTYGKPRWWRWVLYPLGVAIIGVGPYVYYTGYNTWKETSGGLAPTVEEQSAEPRQRRTMPSEASWFRSGIAWIEGQTRGKSGPELVRNSLTAYLYGYSRAEEEFVGGKVPIPDWVLNAAWGSFAAIGILFLAGMVRWPSRRDVHPTAGPWSSWQVLLWLGLWVALPTYGFFYCRSVKQPDSPVDWVKAGLSFASWHMVWIVPLCGALAWQAARRRALNMALAWALGVSLVVIVALAVIGRGAEWYVAVMDWASSRWLVGALFVVAAAVSWASCAKESRERVRRLIAGVAVAVLILLVCEVAYLVWEQLRQNSRTWYSIWMPRYLAVITPAVLIVLAISFTRLPGRVIPSLVIAAFVCLNVVQYGARIRFDPEPRLDLMAQDIAAADRDPSVAVFVKDTPPYGSPGRGSVNDTVMRYYLFQELGGKLTPMQARHGPTDTLLNKPFGRFHSTRWIVSDLKRRPAARRVVLWEKTSLSRDSIETIQKALGPMWQLESEWSQETRRHWNWQDLDGLRRYEFRLVGEPATLPADNRPLFGD